VIEIRPLHLLIPPVSDLAADRTTLAGIVPVQLVRHLAQRCDPRGSDDAGPSARSLNDIGGPRHGRAALAKRTRWLGSRFIHRNGIALHLDRPARDHDRDAVSSDRTENTVLCREPHRPRHRTKGSAGVVDHVE